MLRLCGLVGGLFRCAKALEFRALRGLVNRGPCGTGLSTSSCVVRTSARLGHIRANAQRPMSPSIEPRKPCTLRAEKALEPKADNKQKRCNLQNWESRVAKVENESNALPTVSRNPSNSALAPACVSVGVCVGGVGGVGAGCPAPGGGQRVFSVRKFRLQTR